MSRMQPSARMALLAAASLSLPLGATAFSRQLLPSLSAPPQALAGLSSRRCPSQRFALRILERSSRTTGLRWNKPASSRRAEGLAIFAADENDTDAETSAEDFNADEAGEGTATTDNDETEGASHLNETENIAEKVPDIPSFLALGYSVASFMNVVAAIVLICNKNNIGAPVLAVSSLPLSSSAVEAAVSSYQPNLVPTYVAGSLGYLLLAASSCGILSKAVSAGRLYTSDTYKRLTFGTLLFGFLGLLSLPGESGCLASSSSAFLAAFLATQAAKFTTAFASFLGWEYGAGGFGSSVNARQRIKNIFGEIVGGSRRVWRTLPVTDERPATFYRTFFIFATLGNLVFNVPELVYNLRQGAGFFSLSASLGISSVARLGLISVLLYILKDASERNRLEGTTFIQMNILVGLWAWGVGVAQGFPDGLATPFNFRRAADKLIFGLLFINNGVLSQLSKMGIIKRRDEEDPDEDPPFRPIFF